MTHGSSFWFTNVQETPAQLLQQIVDSSGHQKRLLSILVAGDSVSFRLRPGKKGIELRLHDLEATVMDVVWTKNLARFAVSDVVALLEKQREIAYTTVMTTLVRLHRKGLLEREREGKRYLYSAKLSRTAFLESTAREVLDRAVGGHGALVMLSEKVSQASASELDELEALIRNRRRELES
ncbi:MAG TPA: BlaI/MecI/CopY family transcriptional regulator [Polyangiaceae bacterium]|nr:BlaI/MecI/CopY family transcriptional regulator [Polyangiaceae bacterium]